MLSCARISLSILNIVILFYAVDQIIDAKYLSHHASQRVCSSDNASSLLWTGVLFLITTMIGIMGYCCGMRGLQYIYLWILIIWTISTVVLFIFIMATLPKTTAGDAYMQTAAKGVWLNQYKPALQRALVNDKDWHRVTACYMEINICNLIKNTTDEYVFRYVDVRCYSLSLSLPVCKLNQIMEYYMYCCMQVGCCKAPNRCRVLSNKVRSPLESPEMDSECKMWSRMGDQCFECDSCKAAYIANYQEEWESHVPSQIARILLLVGMAALAFFAFDDDDHDHRRDANDQKHGKRVRV